MKLTTSFSAGLLEYVNGREKELDGRKLYSQYISNPSGFGEHTLGSTALATVETRLELRPEKAGTVLR